VDTSAPKGKPGTLLLDPANITVIDDTSAPNDGQLPTILFSTLPGSNLTISNTALLSQLSFNNVTLQATNNINFNANLTGSGSFTTLFAEAGNNITATGTISLTNIGINFDAGNNISTGNITARVVDLDAGGSITTGNTVFSEILGYGRVVHTPMEGIRVVPCNQQKDCISAASFVRLDANSSVTTGNITSSQSSVFVFNRNGDINIGNVTSAGRVDIWSGNFSLNRRIVSVPGTNRFFEDFEPSTYFSFLGNGGNITVGDVTSTGTASVGTIQINTNRNIKTGNLSNSVFSTSGTKIIAVNAGGSIETGFIDTRNSGGIGGDVYVISQNSVVRVNGIGPTGFSIDASGSAGGGDIIIAYGGSSPFSVGSAAVNGTAGGITNGQFSILPFQQFRSRQLGTVRPGTIRIGPIGGDPLIDQLLFGQEFFGLGLDFELDAIEDVALIDLATRFEIAGALGAGDFSAILTLDTLFGNEFSRFLGVNSINDFDSVESVGNMLSRLAKETGKKPAIIYLMVDEQQLSIAAITPGSRTGVASPGILKFDPGLFTSMQPLHYLAQQEAKIQPVVRGIPEARRSQLLPVVERFLNTLKDPRQRTSDAYLKDAQQLYRWLIAPIEQELQAQGIETLLFSMDSGLRLLPVAALHDGKQFLVEKYSTALIPSVNLIDTRYRNIRNTQVLAMGADTFANQAPLPAVPVELKVITEEWPGKSFLNQDFTVGRLTQERLQGGYPIVHLATHADFVPGRLSNSYIEFGNNQRLYLPELRRLPLREPNVVELLTLSACRTSVGDVNAELGFAGLAVQAGVKSALASLWYVSDEGTLALMSEFYRNLRQVPIKAEALRQAQVAMLQGKVSIQGGELRGLRGGIPVPPVIAQRGDVVLNHPYYWAAFTLVGSPW
jgi:CHAT domain-containing protein